MKIRSETLMSGKLASRLAAFRAKLEKKAARGCEAVGKVVLDLSRPNIPVETGTLQRSGRQTKEGDGFAQVVYVGYGGYDLPEETTIINGKTITRKASNYSVYVHEDPNQPPVAPQSHTPPGEAKFLHNVVVGKQDEMRQALNAEVAK